MEITSLQYMTSGKVARWMKDYRGDERENHSDFTHTFADDRGSRIRVILHVANEEAHNDGVKEREKEKNDCGTLVDDTSDGEFGSFLLSVMIQSSLRPEYPVAEG